MFSQFAMTPTLIARRCPKLRVGAPVLRIAQLPSRSCAGCADVRTKTTTSAPPKEGVAFSALGDVPRNADGAVQLYDEWADTYDFTLESWGYEAHLKMAALVKDLVPADANVLDLGCGTGMTGKALVEAGLVGNHFGVDISPVSVERALETNSYKGGAIAASLEEPFPAEVRNKPKFDAIICVGVLLYVHDFECFWKECVNVLKPGGKLCVTQVNTAWMRDLDSIQTKLGKFIGNGELRIESVSQPQPYMPNNPDPVESAKQIRYIVLSKAC